MYNSHTVSSHEEYATSNKHKEFKTAHEKKVYRGQKQCYDCHDMIADIKTHRKICSKSRLAKSMIQSTSKTHVNKRSGNDFYFLLDVSGSMTGIRLNTAKETIADIVTNMDHHSRMAIVSFDTKAYFKLKPRPVGQIIRQKELPEILDRIFAKGLTAIWDAIWLAVSQIRDVSKKSNIIVLTDGGDNSSSHTYVELIQLIEKHANVTVDIIHIGDTNSDYAYLCKKFKGTYSVITEREIKTTITKTFKTYT